MEGEIRVRNLTKLFRDTGFFNRWRPASPVLQDVSLDLEKGELAALVGESGSGKTTLGRCLLGLLPFEGGEVSVNGFDVGKLADKDEKSFRLSAQMVFQNPYSSLNPAFRAREAVIEAIKVHGRNIPNERIVSEIEQLASLVQLPVERLNEYPPQLSGGEKRRVVFARALATNPKFIVTDEPVSGLDQPIQAQLLDLLKKIHQRQKTTMLFISHDLRLVRFIATRVIVMHRGRIVEDAPSERFFGEGPKHPYSRELLDCAFSADMGRLKVRHMEPPMRGARGCSFRHRCAQWASSISEVCARETPSLKSVDQCHRVACHSQERETP